MALRDMIEIDEELCDGCGECVTACAEGAIAIVGGKAKLISEVYCDGLGACLGHCPQGALTVVRREAADFDEAAVTEHLSGRRHAAATPLPIAGPPMGGCPGSRVQTLTGTAGPQPHAMAGAPQPSALRQWPIQLHLLPPTAPFLEGSDLLLAADCVAFSIGGFHDRFLAGHSLAVACPKLDSNQEVYLHKLVAMIDEAKIASITVMVMEVPCCGGLLRLVQQAASMARRSMDITVRMVSVRGEVLSEHAVPARAAG